MKKVIEKEILIGVRAVQSRGVNVIAAGGSDAWAVGVRGVGGFRVEECGDGRVVVDGEIVEIADVAYAVDMSLNSLL